MKEIKPWSNEDDSRLVYLLADGYKLPYIAKCFGLRPIQLRNHVVKLKVDVGSETAAGLVAHYLRKGLIK